MESAGYEGGNTKLIRGAVKSVIDPTHRHIGIYSPRGSEGGSL